jgi:sulfate adenylyltransferase
MEQKKPGFRELGKGRELMLRPHGGKLVNRVLSKDAKNAVLEDARSFRKLVVSGENITDIHNITTGIFSPLKGFLNHEDLTSIVKHDTLAKGISWTIPILLSVGKEESKRFSEGESILLTKENGNPVALMELEDKFSFDRSKLCEAVFGTTKTEHPGVKKTFEGDGIYLGGDIQLLELEKHHYDQYKLTPAQTRYLFREKGWKTVVGFQTRNPPHRAHEYLQKCALEICDGLFINPVIGKKKVGDFTDPLILKAYETHLRLFFPPNRAVMSILPFEMRYAGPKEAIFHAIVRKNFGCTHFIVGRDHAGVGNYYDSYAAQRIFEDFEDLGIQPLFFDHSFFCRKCGSMGTTKTCPHDKKHHMGPSGTKIRAIVTEGSTIAPEIMRPQIAALLREAKDPFVK